MSDRTEAEIRNAALEEAAQVCDKSSLQPAIAARIRALKSAPAAEESAKGADVAQPKRRPYNASASLSEYGVFPECDAAPAAQAPAKGASDGWRIDHSAGCPILVYQNCSVIEAEQAEYVLRLIEADRQQRGGDVVSAFDAAVAAELPKVSTLEYNSHEICKHFAERVRAALAATKGESK
ncbi:hypothetical protein CAL18_12605 [Bordetella genomosp. 7]|uniref:hypothetical protein n=1 Tax=Bordetella genomosp. 7 TaxID=1416805 RepID=UPI000B9E3106|nr:hypothetical protein [Bordetella genomosp. 7]OZI21758.1 hypothetical protein CAL18_12605 [Bordetella genomosp. 7]